MPIYEYYCDCCQKKFETLIRSGETAECPECGTEDVKRLISACGFVSKGSGGETVSTSAGSSCGSCAATSCATCGV